MHDGCIKLVMPIIVNYVDTNERVFLETASFVANNSSLWTSNGVVSVDASIFQDALFGSLKLVPSAAENFIKFNYWSLPASEIPSQFSITKPIHQNTHVESFLWVRPTVNCTVYLKTVLTEVYYDTANSQNEFVDPVVSIVGNEGFRVIAVGGTEQPVFNLLRSVPVLIPNNGIWSVSLQFRVVFETLNNASLNISRPTSYSSERIFTNNFLQQSFNFFPEVFLESDVADNTKNEPTYAMTRLIDVATSISDEIFDEVFRFEFRDKSEGFNINDTSTFSTFINPEVCDSSYLPWLSQFRGRPILITYEPSTNSVPWQIFVIEDPNSLLDGNNVLGNDATNFGGLPQGVVAFARWQVETGYYGHNAGSIEAMVGAIQRNLTGSKVVNFTRSTNQINFTTSQAETFGTVAGDVGSSNASILSLIQPAKPLGMLVTHTLTA